MMRLKQQLCIVEGAGHVKELLRDLPRLLVFGSTQMKNPKPDQRRDPLGCSTQLVGEDSRTCVNDVGF